MYVRRKVYYGFRRIELTPFLLRKRSESVHTINSSAEASHSHSDALGHNHKQCVIEALGASRKFVFSTWCTFNPCSSPNAGGDLGQP